MLVRRIATVTICAPLASIAARVSVKSRYLPVPTSSRESYALPAMTSLSFAMPLPSSHGHHDLDAIAVREVRVAEAAARNDLSVPLDGQAPARQLHLVEKLGEGERGGEFARHPVQRDLNGHERIISLAPATSA